MAVKKKKRPRIVEKAMKGATIRVAYALALREEDGKTYGQVTRALMERFRISKNTAELDQQKSNEMLRIEMEKELPLMAARMTARLWKISNNAFRRGDNMNAIRAIAEMRAINGIEAPKPALELKGGINDEARALLAALHMTPAERMTREEDINRQLADLDAANAPADGVDEPLDGEPEAEVDDPGPSLSRPVVRAI